MQIRGTLWFSFSTAFLSHFTFAEETPSILPRVIVLESRLDNSNTDFDEGFHFGSNLIQSYGEESIVQENTQNLGQETLKEGFFSDQNPTYFGILNLNDSWAPNRELTTKQIPLPAPRLSLVKEIHFTGKLQMPFSISAQGEYLDPESKKYQAVSFLSAQNQSEASLKSLNTEIDAEWRAAFFDKRVFSPTIEGSFFVNFEQLEMDSGGGTGGDDPDAFSQNASIFYLLEWRLPSEILMQGAYKFQIRKSQNDVDGLHSDSFKEVYQSHSIPLSFEKLINVHEKMQWTLKSDFRYEIGDSSVESYGDSVGTTSQKSFGDSLFQISLGSQIAKTHSKFRPSLLAGVDSFFWENFSVAHPKGALLFDWDFATQHQLKFGTSLFNQAPSLYQIYSRYGSTNLKAEQDLKFEISWNVHFNTKSFIQIALFRRKISQLIDFDFSTEKYLNASSAMARGLDLIHEWKFFNAFQSKVHFQMLDTKNNSDGQILLRRPKLRCDFMLLYDLNENSQFQTEMEHLGKRDDIDPQSFQRIPVAPYTLFHLGYLKKLDSNSKLAVRVRNILNTAFEEILGYRSGQRIFELQYQRSLW